MGTYNCALKRFILFIYYNCFCFRIIGTVRRDCTHTRPSRFALRIDIYGLQPYYKNIIRRRRRAESVVVVERHRRSALYIIFKKTT